MDFVIKGNICYSKTAQKLETLENGFAVCENGISQGVFPVLPEQYKALPLTDCGDNLVIPGLCDLHVHAPQYTFRGLGMDLELPDWLNTYTFPEESKYADYDYAEKAYSNFVNDLTKGATTRAGIFATIHCPGTMLLMEKLERSGLVSYVGKVNMDRNSPDTLRETSAAASIADTREWLEAARGRFSNTQPILSPRFIPSCTDDLMRQIGALQRELKLPVQSHLSENQSEIAWVKELCPKSAFYGDAYNRVGLFGGEGVPTIMAHCVWSCGAEEDLIKANGVYVAHCPQSNMNLASGIAPVRRFLNRGIKTGLGSDVAGGCHTSIFRAMSDAIQVSKLRWRLVDQNETPLTVPEAFYLGTLGGGSFFGKVGSFEKGYEFDALVIDDSNFIAHNKLSIEDRLSRIIYFSSDSFIWGKYIRGRQIL